MFNNYIRKFDLLCDDPKYVGEKDEDARITQLRKTNLKIMTSKNTFLRPHLREKPLVKDV